MHHIMHNTKIILAPQAPSVTASRDTSLPEGGLKGEVRRKLYRFRGRLFALALRAVQEQKWEPFLPPAFIPRGME